MSRHPLWRLLLALTLPCLWACAGEVTEEDLQKWSNNDIGFERLQEVVADVQQPMETRVRALEVVVEKSKPRIIVGIIDAIPQDRLKVVAALTERLLAHLDPPDTYALDAKDALMIMQRYVSEEEFESIRVAVARWAFPDVTWEASTKAIQEAIEPRISSGQIADLGPHGWEASAILVSHGFTQNYLDILTEANDAKASDLLLKGLRKLHAQKGVGMHHIDAIAKSGSAMGASYLFDLYLDETLQQDYRIHAFDGAQRIIYGNVKLGKAPGRLVEQLLTIMSTKDPEDRWFASRSLIRLTGAEHLKEIFARFLDDGIYGDAQEEPSKSLQDLCFDIFDWGHAEAAKGTLMNRVRDPNRIVQAISVVCLKVNEAHVADNLLKAFSRELLSGRDPSLDDFLGNGYSLGVLTRNAIDGLALIRDPDLKASDEAAEANRVLLTKFELKARGDALKKIVAERQAAWLAEGQPGAP